MAGIDYSDADAEQQAAPERGACGVSYRGVETPRQYQGEYARPDCDVRRQPQADGDSEQSDGDQSHRGAGQRPPGRLGQGSEAPAERVLLPGRRAEEEDERSRRPDGQQEGGGDEAPPQRRLVVWVGWWDRYAHSVPPPLSIDETELDGAGLRRPSFYYTTFRVK